jgi:hypothetical protein
MAWKSSPDVTTVFANFAKNPFISVDIQSDNFHILERCTIILYQKTSQRTLVNEDRREMFCQQSKAIEVIPQYTVCTS